MNIVLHTKYKKYIPEMGRGCRRDSCSPFSLPIHTRARAHAHTHTHTLAHPTHEAYGPAYVFKTTPGPTSQYTQCKQRALFYLHKSNTALVLASKVSGSGKQSPFQPGQENNHRFSIPAPPATDWQGNSLRGQTIAIKMRQAFWVLALACVFVTVDLQRPQQLKDYWMDLGQRKLREKLNTKPNTNVAKNVIIFIGDGLGVSTVTAARIHKGQLQGKTGEEGSLFFENFPYVGLSKTYNTDRMVSDSAGTATAILCGVKTKFGLIGVDDRTSFGNCTSEEGASVDSILKWANAEGKSTGIITTTRITHATPASGFAHSASRYWEADADLPADARGTCTDIAKQMIEGDGSFIKVILGGGRRQFYHRNESDPEYPNVKGKRTDRNLINQWLQAKADMNMRAEYVWNSTGFNSVEPADVDFLMGLFEPSHMQYEGERNHAMEPSLAEMTEKAIKILKKNAKGFVLLVEGGRIDHGHHASLARHAVTDTIAMEAAVKKAAELTSANDTLTVVTADHSHVFNIGGYAGRGIPILGVNDAENDKNGVPYTVLSYGNGPGYTAPREDPTTVNTSSWNYVYQSAVLTASETHGGEEVPVYAQGPMSHLFDFVYEQSYIAHVMAYAACVGPNKDHCKMAPPTPTTSGGSSLEFSVTKALVVTKMVVAVMVAVIL